MHTIDSIKNYFKRTYENKLVAMFMVLAGLLLMKFDNDITFLLLGTPFAVALFFYNKNIFEED